MVFVVVYLHVLRSRISKREGASALALCSINGLIACTMVLTTVGISTEYLPVLMAVDWLIARLRSVLNVLSDSVNALVLDKISGSGAS